ncbi:MAG: hypothetical protein JXR78_08575 [Victivallales bacterium]|nr:hypothetical protein [Victivallales bacterium]
MSKETEKIEDALWQEFGQYLQSISKNFTEQLEAQYKASDRQMAKNFNSRMEELAAVAKKQELISLDATEKIRSLVSETQSEFKNINKVFRSTSDEIANRIGDKVSQMESRQHTIQKLVLISLIFNLAILGWLVWSKVS